MWLSAAVLGALVATLAAVPLPEEDVQTALLTHQESITQLTQMLDTLVREDQESRLELRNTMVSLQETQTNILKFFKAPGEVSTHLESAGLENLTQEIVTAIQGGQLAGNSSVLRDILAELRNLNTLFREHLSSLSCPPPFLQMGSECFYFILEDTTWEDARQQCLNKGADLAQPADLTSLRIYIGNRYPRKNQRNFWIGGQSHDKVWQWLNGDPIDESYWYTNEPSGNGECLAMFDGWEHPLTDFPCANERRAVCERDMTK